MHLVCILFLFRGNQLLSLVRLYRLLSGLKTIRVIVETWEARQIYGAIINDSRSFGYTLRDALKNENPELTKAFFYRHFAWLTALRYQLREPRKWETMDSMRSQKFMLVNYKVHEWETPVEEELKKYLTEKELAYILSKKNKAAQIIAMQSEALAKLKEQKIIDDFQWNNLQNGLHKLIDNQGKAERIKNFPYPRNFASANSFLLKLFVFLLPFGLLKEFTAMGVGTALEGISIWFNIPISVIVTWGFLLLEEVGGGAINPFQVNVNDVPITQISRAIEIDMRDMLDEKQLPQPIVPEQDIVL